MGLDYLHTECYIIHTGSSKTIRILQKVETCWIRIDLKLDHVKVGFEDPSVIVVSA